MKFLQKDEYRRTKFSDRNRSTIEDNSFEEYCYEDLSRGEFQQNDSYRKIRRNPLNRRSDQKSLRKVFILGWTPSCQVFFRRKPFRSYLIE